MAATDVGIPESSVTVVPHTPEVSSVPGVRRFRLASTLVVLGYAVIGSIAYWPLYPDLSRDLLSVETDYAQTVWFLAWVPHTLFRGLDPLFTHAILVPVGANLAQNTASPLLGLLTAPLTLVMGPVAITNLLVVLAMPLSATAAFWVLRSWHVWLPAAALGGLMYGFSPFMVGQSTGHLDFTFEPFPPLIAWALVRTVDGRGRGEAMRGGCILGLLVAAQYLVSPEVLAMVSVAAGVGLLAAVAHGRVDVRRIVAPLSVAAAVAGVILFYPVWMLVAGPGHAIGRTWVAFNPFHNDILSFVVPGPLQRVALGMRSTGVRLAAPVGSTEAGGYVGIPVDRGVGLPDVALTSEPPDTARARPAHPDDAVDARSSPRCRRQDGDRAPAVRRRGPPPAAR